jgi:hypothetical protein
MLMPLRPGTVTQRWSIVDLPILPFLAPRVFQPWPSRGGRPRHYTASQEALRDIELPDKEQGQDQEDSSASTTEATLSNGAANQDPQPDAEPHKPRRLRRTYFESRRSLSQYLDERERIFQYASRYDDKLYLLIYWTGKNGS